jgi:hypothetical protein
MTLRVDDERTSYIKEMEGMFKRKFPEVLDANQLLTIINLADPEAAEFLAERITRDDMKGRYAEAVRLLETSMVLVWSLTGKTIYDRIVPPGPDIHIPTERLRRERKKKEPLIPVVQIARIAI